MSEPLGVAVLGAGHMGADHVRRLGETVGGARVVAVADPDTARAETAVAGRERVTVHGEALAALDAPGVDAVLVASPEAAHEEALLAACARGLPVFCRSPSHPTRRQPCGSSRPRPAWGAG